MRRTILVTAIAISGASAAPASAANLCVAERAGCYRSIQKAVDAARDGDSIRLGPGVFKGGVTIGASIELRGAGAGATRIRGGGPVLTLGASGPRTIAIRGVTISDGVTTFSTQDGERRPQLALGGGVQVLPDASVTIADSAIVDNVTAPSGTASSPSNAQCPGGTCRYAGGYGAGIYSNGSLTLTRTSVARNRNTGALSSDAEGGGIYSTGPLTLLDSQVVGNEARVQPPYGRFATGGGLFAHDGAVTIRRSTIAGNRALIDSAWPSSVGQGNIGGGILVGDDATAAIDHSRIEGNELRASNIVGDAVAFSGGVHGNGPVSISDSVIASNHVTATVPAGSNSLASADSGMGNLNRGGTITGSRLVGNTVTAVGGAGPAFAAAGALWAWSDDLLEVRDSVVSGNQVSAVTKGTVTAQGGGIVNADVLALHGTDVSQNTVRAAGRSGAAHGGGIWNGRLPDAPEFTPRLSVAGGAITSNAIVAGPGIDVHGGGVFSSEPFRLDRTLIRGNRPDQCAGC